MAVSSWLALIQLPGVGRPSDGVLQLLGGVGLGPRRACGICAAASRCEEGGLFLRSRARLKRRTRGRLASVAVICVRARLGLDRDGRVPGAPLPHRWGGLLEGGLPRRLLDGRSLGLRRRVDGCTSSWSIRSARGKRRLVKRTLVEHAPIEGGLGLLGVLGGRDLGHPLPRPRAEGGAQLLDLIRGRSCQGDIGPG